MKAHCLCVEPPGACWTMLKVCVCTTAYQVAASLPNTHIHAHVQNKMLKKTPVWGPAIFPQTVVEFLLLAFHTRLNSACQYPAVKIYPQNKHLACLWKQEEGNRSHRPCCHIYMWMQSEACVTTVLSFFFVWLPNPRLLFRLYTADA